MDKGLTVKLISTLLMLSMLTGCVGEETQKTQPDTEQKISSVDQAAANPKTIDLELKENHHVHATVYAPEHPISRTYELKPLDIDAETALKVLLPEDTSPFTKETDEEFGRVSLTTQAGHKIMIDRDIVSLGFQDLDKDGKYGEILGLIELYWDEFPEKEPENLDFMTAEEAIAKGEQLLADLGVPYTPEVQFCGSMTHEQLMAYQQERLARDADMEFPDYDPFGKVAKLTDLTAEDDSYSIFYGFSYDDLPVYGCKGEPAIGTRDNVFPPMGTYAQVLISRSGLTSFMLIGAYAIDQSTNEGPLLTADEAVGLYQAYWDETLQPMPEEDWLVDSVYLEYIPKHEGDVLVLTPYWCIVNKSKYTNTLTGKEEWSHGAGMRYNALTGGDFANGD